MRGPDLADVAGRLRLVAPQVERDAPLGVEWLNGPAGHSTMLMLGNPPASLADTTLEDQERLVRGFISAQGELHWMIESEGRVIGAVWIHCVQTRAEVGAPELSLMIGDPEYRGRGLGKCAAELVLAWASKNLPSPVTMRTVVENEVSKNLILGLGGRPQGDVYKDQDGLKWQNYRLPVDEPPRIA